MIRQKLTLMLATTLLVGIVFAVNSVAWSFEERSPSRIPADRIGPIQPPAAAGEKDPCELSYTNWTPAFYFTDWLPGDKNAIYFDPEDCGLDSNYPFQLTNVHLIFYDHAEVESVDVRFSVEALCPDICDGPGIEIWQSKVYTVKTFYPELLNISFSDTVCLDKPFFFNVEYISDHPEGTMPSLLFDTDTLNIDTCYQWFWVEQPYWWEWYDAWTSIPGWVLLRINGFCGDEQTECGEWYWKPDTLPQAPSGMPDFDQNQDQWLAYCGPTAVANCLWWFDAVPPGMQPPELIELLAEYFNTTSGGTHVDSIQVGLERYFDDYGFDHLQEYTFWMPDFYEMEDSLKRCQDIILLLGFWWWDDISGWFREGGHFVTMAGVNSEKKEIAVSDPDRDQSVQYFPWWPGRVRMPDHPLWGQYPHEFHNNPQYVSHDVYISLLYPDFASPGSDKWDLADFCFGGYRYANKNVPERFKAYTKEAPKQLGYYHTEVEAAVMICPKFTAVEEEEGSLTPKDFELHQNYPNPFNNETVIKFDLQRPAEVTVAIYNILGQRVRTLVEGRLGAGGQSLGWDGKDEKGKDLSSGIYFYQLKAGEVSQTKRLVLLK